MQHISAVGKLIDLGEVVLTEGVAVDAVAVTVQKPIVTADAEKLSYSVEDDPEAQSSTLEEIIRKIPQLSIDADGKVLKEGEQVVLGANEGVLPTYPSGDGLLTESERRTLKDLGLSLAEDLLTQCVEERYYAYLALSAPSEQLVVTYQTTAETGASPLITSIRRILPHHTKGVSASDDGWDLETADDMFRRLAENYGDSSAVSAGLRQVMAAHPDYAPRIAALERAATAAPFRIEERENAHGLFGTDMVLSASRADVFYDCKFKYFCRYGLRIKERERVTVDRRVFGILVHDVMEVLLPQYCRPDGLVAQLRQQEYSPLPEAELLGRLQTDVEQCITRYVEEHMGGPENKDGRFRYQMSLAQRSATAVLWHTLKELQQGAFDPVDYELSIHPAEDDTDEGVVSMRLPLKEGSVQFSGKVDRVDLYHRPDGTTYVRVVDYKTGSTRFDLCELTAGLGMQMLLYLFILCDNSRRYLEDKGELRPGGVLYHPLSDLVVERGQSDSDRLRRMRMSGLVLDDTAVVLAMEAEGDSHFIPAKLNKEGKPTGNVVTLSQFRLLRGVVEDLLMQMGEKLLQGDIAALPLKKGESVPCRFCDYRAVCGRDPEDPVTELEKKSMSAVLEDLEAEEVTRRG